MKKSAAGLLVILTILFFFLQAKKSPPQLKEYFNEIGLQKIVASKSPELQKYLEPLLQPKSPWQDRENLIPGRELQPAEKILQNLAPHLWWHPNEKASASDPLEFLKHSERIQWGTHTYLDYKGPAQKIFSQDEKIPLFWKVSRASDLERMQESDPASIILLIEFWYHSHDNPIWLYFGSHQGDWESFAYLIRFHADGKYDLLRVFLSAHTSGQWFCPSDLEWSSDSDPSRIHLYSALDTHATYSHAGLGELGILRDYTERGFEWQAWKWLTPIETENYYGFSGAWGKLSFHPSMSGPLAPHPKFKGLPPKGQKIPELGAMDCR